MQSRLFYFKPILQTVFITCFSTCSVVGSNLCRRVIQVKPISFPDCNDKKSVNVHGGVPYAWFCIIYIIGLFLLRDVHDKEIEKEVNNLSSNFALSSTDVGI